MIYSVECRLSRFSKYWFEVLHSSQLHPTSTHLFYLICRIETRGYLKINTSIEKNMGPWSFGTERQKLLAKVCIWYVVCARRIFPMILLLSFCFYKFRRYPEVYTCKIFLPLWWHWILCSAFYRLHGCIVHPYVISLFATAFTYTLRCCDVIGITK